VTFPTDSVMKIRLDMSGRQYRLTEDMQEVHPWVNVRHRGFDSPVLSGHPKRNL